MPKLQVCHPLMINSTLHEYASQIESITLLKIDTDSYMDLNNT